MNPVVHKVPSGTFAALAQGGGGAAGGRCLSDAQHSKHVLLLRRVVDLARSTSHDEADAATRAYGQLAAIQEERPDAVDAVIRHPAVGAWARQAVDALASAERRPGAGLTWMSAVAAAAAIRGGMSLPVHTAAADGAVMLPSLGRATTPTGSVCILGGGVEIDGVRLPDELSTDTPNWQGLRRLSAASAGMSIELLIDDLDPYRAPGVDNAGDRLPAAEALRWQTVLHGAWDLLVRHHGTVAEEMTTMIRVLTPLRPPAGDHLSATSRDAFGAIMLSAPQDASSLAVTMAHEVQHAKLCALLDLAAMTLPDDGRRYYAPWREDPRPVSGLLQGAYAFLGVAGFWRRQGRLTDGEASGEPALAEFARWLGAVRLAVEALSRSGMLTGTGGVFVSGMDRTLRRWEAEPVPDDARAAARQANAEHQELWRQRNGDIPMPVA